ncbi:MAG TPA: type II toxin-antitoxin system RelE/ParE family toxin [Candidatus Limnocylindria bacterium]|nr:type II toxin-antitoxin system RelE/ParE family toxin [Candidatus Limnocylindria bacterium]
MGSPRKVAFSRAAADAIRAAHPDLRRKIRAVVDTLSDRPDVGKALVDELDGCWSARVGRHRIVYRWSRAGLEVVLVGPRATIYEESARLLRRDSGRGRP